MITQTILGRNTVTKDLIQQLDDPTLVDLVSSPELKMAYEAYEELYDSGHASKDDLRQQACGFASVLFDRLLTFKDDGRVNVYFPIEAVEVSPFIKILAPHGFFDDYSIYRISKQEIEMGLAHESGRGISPLDWRILEHTATLDAYNHLMELAYDNAEMIKVTVTHKAFHHDMPVKRDIYLDASVFLDEKNSVSKQLELIYDGAQNIYSPAPVESMSMGDEIEIHGRTYICESLGFNERKISDIVHVEMMEKTVRTALHSNDRRSKEMSGLDLSHITSSYLTKDITLRLADTGIDPSAYLSSQLTLEESLDAIGELKQHLLYEKLLHLKSEIAMFKASVFSSIMSLNAFNHTLDETRSIAHRLNDGRKLDAYEENLLNVDPITFIERGLLQTHFAFKHGVIESDNEMTMTPEIETVQEVDTTPETGPTDIPDGQVSIGDHHASLDDDKVSLESLESRGVSDFVAHKESQVDRGLLVGSSEPASPRSEVTAKKSKASTSPAPRM